MRAFYPQGKPRTNRIEAMWYQPWQAGYHDIIKRGFPKPSDDRIILAELRTAHVEDFLHQGADDVPFLVSARARAAFEKCSLTGFDFGPVAVAKIASKGLRNQEQKTGEPEDGILKARGIGLDSAPALFAVWVTGFVEVVPDYESGKTPSGAVSPFRAAFTFQGPDVWRPRYRGVTFSAWTFCSNKFRSTCEEHQLSNIKFESFDVFMEEFRGRLTKNG